MTNKLVDFEFKPSFIRFITVDDFDKEGELLVNISHILYLSKKTVRNKLTDDYHIEYALVTAKGKHRMDEHTYNKIQEYIKVI